MIIDAHAHIGAYKDWNWSADYLISLMDAAGVDHAVISNVAANDDSLDQFDCADAIIDECAAHPERLSPLFWINPRQKFDARRAIEYSRRVRGFKAHPQEARVPFGEGAYSDFLRLCADTGLSMSVHTQVGEYCDIARVARVCAEYPAARVIAVHGELFGNHIRAFELAKNIENLYIETSFVPPETVAAGAAICGAEKLLFGSDAPAMGEGSYTHVPALEKLAFSDDFMRNNAAKIFGLEV